MTPTNLQLATHYKLNKDTVQKWKRTRPEVYEAMCVYYHLKNAQINNSVEYAQSIESGRKVAESIVSNMLNNAIAKVVSDFKKDK